MYRFLEKTSLTPKRSLSAPKALSGHVVPPERSFYFFNPDLKLLSGEANGTDWRFSKLNSRQWMTCGDPRKVRVDKIAALVRPPVKRTLWAEMSSDSSQNATPCAKPLDLKIDLTTTPIKLEAPPPCKHNIAKRLSRSKFPGETETSEFYTGQLKFYQLKKRFGFVKLDNEDIFLCEDEIVLSGLSAKRFKAAVLKNRNLSLSFRIKSYYDKDRLRRKAVDISLLNN